MPTNRELSTERIDVGLDEDTSSTTGEARVLMEDDDYSKLLVSYQDYNAVWIVGDEISGSTGDGGNSTIVLELTGGMSSSTRNVYQDLWETAHEESRESIDLQGIAEQHPIKRYMKDYLVESGADADLDEVRERLNSGPSLSELVKEDRYERF